MSFYADMQGVATELLGEFKQGVVEYIEPGEGGGDPWNPEPGEDTPYPVDAAVKGVSQEYIDGTYVLATDLEAIMSVFDVEPSNKGRLSVDGKELQIVKVMKIPAAGTTVAWRLIVRA